MVNDNKIEDLLLRLIEDVAFIKAKISSIEEQNLGSRIDALEAENREHDRIIKSLENRNNKMEEFTRGQIVDAKKQQTSVFISMGLALLSTVLSIVSGLLF